MKAFAQSALRCVDSCKQLLDTGTFSSGIPIWFKRLFLPFQGCLRKEGRKKGNASGVLCRMKPGEAGFNINVDVGDVEDISGVLK